MKGIRCRFHGFTINKPLQQSAITGVAYRLAPQRIVHSGVEVSLAGRWSAAEGFFLDAPCLASLRRRAPKARRFCSYGAATPDLSAPWTPPIPPCIHRAKRSVAEALRPAQPLRSRASSSLAAVMSMKVMTTPWIRLATVR